MSGTSLSGGGGDIAGIDEVRGFLADRALVPDADCGRWVTEGTAWLTRASRWSVPGRLERRIPGIRLADPFATGRPWA